MNWITETTLAILGAPDPERTACLQLLTAAGVSCLLATKDGRAVNGQTAYQADPPTLPKTITQVLRIECSWTPDCAEKQAAQLGLKPHAVVVIDHHRPGDPGYGQPPTAFLPASSIGQVIDTLAWNGALPVWDTFHEPSSFGSPIWNGYRWLVSRSGMFVPTDLVMIAASDHCPAAAYQGRCPGVDPDALMRWRATTRAEFQGRPVQAILADVEAARDAIGRAPVVMMGGVAVSDLRPGTVPELPEAALRTGAVVLAEMRTKDGRQQIVLQGAGEGTVGGTAPIDAFLNGWAAAQGLEDLYGDPARGYAGGYRPDH